MAIENPIPFHHFTRDDEDSIPFELHTLEKRTYYDFSVPHRHNYFELFIFEKGGGSHLIDFNEFRLTNRSVHFVSPGQVHMLKRAPGSHGYIVVFSRDFFNDFNASSRLLYRHPLLHNRTHYPIMEPTNDLFEALMDCVLRMKDEIGSKRSFRAELIRIYLQEFLLKSIEGLVEKSKLPDLVMEFFAVLETRFFELHQVREYASALKCTDRFLGDVLKTHTGKGTQEHINQRIVLEAKRLLQFSELNVREIGFRLGFEDPAHFGKFIKKHLGTSPGAFRKGEPLNNP